MSHKIRTDIKSLNFNEREKKTSLEFLILHFTECDLFSALNILTESQSTSRVSVHYVIDIKGEIYQLVDEEKRAWHAGQSCWKNLEDINSRSIGIEIINLGYGSQFSPYPKIQMESVQKLSKDIINRYSIPSSFVLGHSDIAPYRKIDPGHFFDWKKLAQEGIGLYPNEPIFQEHNEIILSPQKKNVAQNILQDIQSLLIRYGYDLQPSHILDKQTQQVLRAFQMHFYPESYQLEDLKKADGPDFINIMTDYRLEICLSRLKKLNAYA